RLTAQRSPLRCLSRAAHTRSISTVPNRPYGFIIRISTSTTKGTTDLRLTPSTGSMKPAVRFSRTPMSSPPTTAPGTLSRPPTMTAGKTRMPMVERPSVLKLVILPTTTPAATALTSAMPHDTAKIFRTLTPRDKAACWSSATARMATPSVLRLKNRLNKPKNAAETAKPKRCTGERYRSPMMMGTSGMNSGNKKYPGPQMRYMTPLITLESPMLTMMTAMTSLPMSGRSTTRSTMSPSTKKQRSVRMMAGMTGRRRLVVPPVVAPADDVAADQDLAFIADTHVYAGKRGACGFKLDVAVPVKAEDPRGLRLAVALLEVDAEGVEKAEDVGAQGGARRVRLA